MLATFLRSIVAASVIAAAGPCGAEPAASTNDGIALYLQGRDHEAVRSLESAERRDQLTPLHRLALADLYLMTGYPTKAAAILETIASGSAGASDYALWISWVDFVSGRATRGTRALATLLETDADSAIRGRTRLSLAWQLLLRGRSAEAASVLDGFEAESGFPELLEQATLLRGQALLWAGRLDEAERVLATVDAPTLRADAARDMAWIHFQRGDSELAAAELQAVIDEGDTGHSPLTVSWARALHAGPQTLKRGWLTAYRKRPRGQDPTVFLTSLADRDAARDARELVAGIDTGVTRLPPTTFSVPTRASRPAASRPGSATSSTGAGTAGHRGVNPAQAATIPWRLLLACGLAAVAIAVHRRTSRPANPLRGSHDTRH